MNYRPCERQLVGPIAFLARFPWFLERGSPTQLICQVRP